MAGEDLIVQFKLEESDYFDAQRLMGAQTPRERAVYVGLTILLVVGVGTAFLSDPETTAHRQVAFTLMGVVTGFWLAWAGVRFMYFPKRLKRLVQEQSPADRRFDMSWDGSGIVFYTPRGKRTCPWSGFTKWREDSRVFLMYLQDGCMYLVPKRCFPSVTSISEFGAMVRSKIGLRESLPGQDGRRRDKIIGRDHLQKTDRL